ncbi:MAG: hypothetical protein KC619_13720 [Myxococcales bacterium]|nr:hypothetical protein [Myxococcales bacterium]
MTNSRALALTAITLWLAAPAVHAQDEGQLPPGHPPTGEQLPPGHPPMPAEDEGELPPGHPAPTGAPSGAVLPEGHPTPTGGTASPGMSSQMQRALRPPSAAPASESADVAEGAIRVLVVDPEGQPVADQPVDVGVLASGQRDRRNARTGADGVAWFRDLATGNDQHYRVNVPYQGATYSSMPFALPAGGNGYSVRVVRLPATRSDQFVFFHVFRTIVEQRGERMHVIHQTELTNAGTETFVFPEEGARAALPEDAVNFQFQRVMTDQRVEEIEGEHAYVMRGSLPPGTVRMAWGYELPIAGGDMDIPVDIPMGFFGMQVIVEAIPELGVSVRGMPRPQRLDVNGQPCQDSVSSQGCAWVVQTQRGPSDAALDHIVIRITGIPGPGPMRLIAVGLVLVFAMAGLLLLVTGRATGSAAEAREARRAAIRKEAEELAEELEEGEVGPEFAARRRAELARELAGLYYAEEIVSSREEEEAERWRTAGRRPGVAGYLTPAEGSPTASVIAEYVFTALALPLLPLCVAFVGIRPRAALSMRGQGEVALTLVNGVLGVVLALLVGDTFFPDSTGITLGVIGVAAAALTLRTIVRRSPVDAGRRATS